VKSVSILRGRDRMCSVLEPLLGFELARERANNIAQVLAILPEDPYEVARTMLGRSGLSELDHTAGRVAEAWEQGVSEMERVA
jgi:hypothetical protein